jgi:hypothetical protein
MGLPVVSGKATAAVLALCLGLTALIVLPLTGYFHMPPWVRAELLLTVWWLVWVFALTRFLYLGHRVSDDLVIRGPRTWFGTGANMGSSSGWSWADPGLVDAEGCAIALGIIAAIFVAIAGLWFLIEIAIPALFALLYFLVRGMLARVVNDKHHCKDNLGKAFSWALVWATLYLAPLAFIAWLAHAWMAGRPPAAG